MTTTHSWPTAADDGHATHPARGTDEQDRDESSWLDPDDDAASEDDAVASDEGDLAWLDFDDEALGDVSWDDAGWDDAGWDDAGVRPGFGPPDAGLHYPAVPRPGAVLHDDEDVLAYLRDVVGPVTGAPALWVLVLDDADRATPVVLIVEDLAPVPDRHALPVSFGRAILEALDFTASPELVVGVVRRGGGSHGAFEARWCGAVREAAHDLGVPLRAVVAIGRNRASILP